MNIKKYLVFLPLIAGCNGLGKNNLAPEVQCSGGKAVSINPENYKNTDNLLLGTTACKLVSTFLDKSPAHLLLSDIFNKKNYQKIQEKLSQCNVPNTSYFQNKFWYGLIKYIIEFNKQKIILSHVLFAVENNYLELLKGLCKNGADINAKSKYGNTLLHHAAQYGHFEISKLLIDSGVDKDAKDNYGTTALHKAAQYGHFEIVKLLIDSGVDKDARNDFGTTALHKAAENGHFEIVKLLIESGVDKDVKDLNGKTPLHKAAKWGHFEIVKLLIDSGADKHEKNNYGKTALYYVKNILKGAHVAKWEEYRKILEVLQEDSEK